MTGSDPAAVGVNAAPRGAQAPSRARQRCGCGVCREIAAGMVAAALASLDDSARAAVLVDVRERLDKQEERP